MVKMRIEWTLVKGLIWIAMGWDDILSHTGHWISEFSHSRLDIAGADWSPNEISFHDIISYPNNVFLSLSNHLYANFDYIFDSISSTDVKSKCSIRKWFRSPMIYRIIYLSQPFSSKCFTCIVMKIKSIDNIRPSPYGLKLCLTFDFFVFIFSELSWTNALHFTYFACTIYHISIFSIIKMETEISKSNCKNETKKVFSVEQKCVHQKHLFSEILFELQF